MRAIAFALLVAAGTAGAQTLKVSRMTWDGLLPAERSTIQLTQIVEIFEHGTFGTVIDAQGADRSEPGTSAGAFLGSVGAQAAYVDRAFSGNRNYSALAQLGFAVLGGVVGSAMDRPASQQYQFRYALRLPNGEIQYADATDKDPFRHPPGVCLSLPWLRPISQAICTHGPDDLRRQFLGTPSPAAAASTSLLAAAPVQAAPQPVGDPRTSGAVFCRLGNLAPVSTTAEKCEAIGGIKQ